MNRISWELLTESQRQFSSAVLADHGVVSKRSPHKKKNKRSCQQKLDKESMYAKMFPLESTTKDWMTVGHGSGIILKSIIALHGGHNFVECLKADNCSLLSISVLCHGWEFTPFSTGILLWSFVFLVNMCFGYFSGLSMPWWMKSPNIQNPIPPLASYQQIFDCWMHFNKFGQIIQNEK